MSKQKIYISKTKEQFIDWLKNEYHYTPIPEPEPVDQFNFLYKKEGDTVWKKWTPQLDDIQIVDEKVTIKATGFKAMDGFADVREVKLPNKWNNGSEVVDVTNIGYQAFYNCSGLTSVTIPNGVTSIRTFVFDGCSSLSSVTIPDSITSIEHYAFRTCTSLTSVTIPDSVTWIGNYAFLGCTSLMSVTIPDSVTSIGEGAFRKCTSLRKVTIGNGVTSIGVNTFSNCSGLISVTIPDNVTSIGDYAFDGCSGLTNVEFEGNAPTAEASAFIRVASGCKAIISSTATGFPAAGKTWNGLIVEVKQ